MKGVDLHIVPLQRSLEVLVASHNNSQYFIANGHDITTFVKNKTKNFPLEEINEDSVLKEAWNEYTETVGLHRITVPMFQFKIMNCDRTSFETVMAILVDIWHKTPEEALMIAHEIDQNGEAVMGTYMFEQVVSYGRMLDMVSEQLNQEIKYRFPLVDATQDSLSKLNDLISDK